MNGEEYLESIHDGREVWIYAVPDLTNPGDTNLFSERIFGDNNE